MFKFETRIHLKGEYMRTNLYIDQFEIEKDQEMQEKVFFVLLFVLAVMTNTIIFGQSLFPKSF